jgi:hypothetical protein
MADDRWTTWQAEQAATNRLPSIWATFTLFAVLTVALLMLLGGPQAYAEHVDQGNAHKPPTLCAEHAGRPGWDTICAETARRR